MINKLHLGENSMRSFLPFLSVPLEGQVKPTDLPKSQLALSSGSSGPSSEPSLLVRVMLTPTMASVANAARRMKSLIRDE